MRARHIAICFHDFARGGTERVALTLAREWLDAGRRVTILCGSRGGGTVEQADRRIEILELQPPIPRSALSRARLGPAMARPLQKIAPDVVFAPGNFHFVLGHPLRRALPNTPLVAKVSNPLLPVVPWPLSAIGAAICRAYVAPFDTLVFMAEELAEEGRRVLPAEKIAVIAEPNLPRGWKAPGRKGPEDVPLVLAVGRMEPQKDFSLALRAFAGLRKSRAARLVVLGEGAERGRLEALALELGIAGDVEMPGYVAATAEWMARASALLLTSRYEGYPAVVVEALAGDCPVVATDCTPVLRGLVNSPMHGRVVAAKPAELASALCEVLDMPFNSGGVRPATVAHNGARESAAAWLSLFDRLSR